jgi:hypothetical protein
MTRDYAAGLGERLFIRRTREGRQARWKRRAQDFFRKVHQECHRLPEQLARTAAHSRSRQARCALWSHQFGWELRLTVNHSVIRTRVCRAFADIVTASAEWQGAMREQGWE